MHGSNEWTVAIDPADLLEETEVWQEYYSRQVNLEKHARPVDPRHVHLMYRGELCTR